MRKLNHDQLNFWLSQNVNGIAKLSTLTGMGFYTIRRIVQKKREPKLIEQKALCEATGLEMNDLFPFVEKREQAS